MTVKPKYTLGDDADGLKIVVFEQYGSFIYDSFYMLDPSESESGAWEIWLAEWDTPDMRQAKLINKQLEIYSDWVTRSEHVHLVLKSLQFGYEVGEYDGQSRVQAINKFAFAAMTGLADIMEVNEAAHSAGFGIDEDGRNFGNKDINQ